MKKSSDATKRVGKPLPRPTRTELDIRTRETVGDEASADGLAVTRAGDGHLEGGALGAQTEEVSRRSRGAESPHGRSLRVLCAERGSAEAQTGKG